MGERASWEDMRRALVLIGRRLGFEGDDFSTIDMDERVGALLHRIAILERERDELLQKLGDWTDERERILDENCPTDEAHCTCVPVLRARVAELVEQKNGAYSERNALVAALSKLLPSFLARHPETDTTWEDDWRWIVFVDTPAGQLSWHVHESELGALDHLERLEGEHWDGHTTNQKYERLAALGDMMSPDDIELLPATPERETATARIRAALEARIAELEGALAETRGAVREEHLDLYTDCLCVYCKPEEGSDGN